MGVTTDMEAESQTYGKHKWQILPGAWGPDAEPTQKAEAGC